MKQLVSAGGRTFAIEAADDDPYIRSVSKSTDRHLWEFCSRHLDGDSVILDIGANVGVTSCILSHIAPSGLVFALEPGPVNFGWLARNMQSNCLANVTPLNTAVSDFDGEARFYENSAYGALQGGSLTGARQITVRVAKVDSLVSQLQLSRLDLVKVDVEGFEPKVLEGMSETLSRFDPVICMEFNAWTLMAHGAKSPLEFISALLDELEFVAILREDGALRRVRCGEAVPFLHDHLVALPKVSDLILRRSASLPTASGQWAALRGAGLAARQEEDLSQCTQERDALREELSQCAQERDALREELSQCAQELGSLTESRSWRVTRPLRTLRSKCMRG